MEGVKHIIWHHTGTLPWKSVAYYSRVYCHTLFQNPKIRAATASQVCVKAVLLLLILRHSKAWRWHVVQTNFVTIGQMMQNAKHWHVRAWWYSKNCLFSFQKENWVKEHENGHLLIPLTCHWIADHYWALSCVKIRPTHKWRIGSRLKFFLYKICYMPATPYKNKGQYLSNRQD